jgi:hypothetical protein
MRLPDPKEFNIWNDLLADLMLLKQCDLNEYQMGLVERLDGHLADCINQYVPDSSLPPELGEL